MDQLKHGTLSQMLPQLEPGMTIKMPRETLTVFKPGTTVQTKSGLDVLILEAQITHSLGVDYIIAYWKEGIRYTQTVPEFELKFVSECEIVEIGFHTLQENTHGQS